VSRDVKVEGIEAYDMQPAVEPKPAEPKRKSVEDEMLEMITPSNQARQNDRLYTTAEMATQNELESLAAPDGFDPLDELPETADTVESPMPSQTASRIEWVFEGGQWKAIEVQTAPAGPTDFQPELLDPDQFSADRKSSEPEIPGDFGLSDIGTTETVTRVIQIPMDKLIAGDPRYDIIIRPGDRITVPRDLIGEFYVGGNVNAPNAYPLTGRPITLMQAVTIAGGLNQIAWPKKVEVRRRMGKNAAGLMQQEIVLVDLAEIAKGTQPDFFIKQHDHINVGTHGTARWLAVLRNAFRATYGFGLIYDRNFADRDFGNDPLPFF
jgi:hypothetical protein